MNTAQEYRDGLKRGGEIMKAELIRAGYSKTRASASNFTSSVVGFILGFLTYYWFFI